MELRAGDAVAVLRPDLGAALTRLDHAGRPLIVPVPNGADPNTGFHGAYVMAPWTNRLDAGRIVVAGIEHRMAINRPDENTALHGFLRELPWSVESSGSDHAVLACAFDRAPFAGTARLEVRLADDHLALALRLTNRGAAPTPMGLGWHPFFPRPAGTRLHAATRIVFGRDARTLPVAPRPCAGLNGGDAVLVGLDTHFAGWDGHARLDWPDGRGLTLGASGAWATNLQVFAPPSGSVIAVEPVSHAPDAPNRPAAAAHGAMHVLPPDGSIEGSLMIHWHR
ncbi:aldose epimerase family protein [Falsiroseomonas oryziterrae]|uniref:aldose epimerase family protein n=1 Tax=Falsiroseomonas oryziterrae TaxID=2911368 RepID=UPI001F408766|nr:aldose epimerase [Roseomonas sp. NPKOSM-4]